MYMEVFIDKKDPKQPKSLYTILTKNNKLWRCSRAKEKGIALETANCIKVTGK